VIRSRRKINLEVRTYRKKKSKSILRFLILGLCLFVMVSGIGYFVLGWIIEQRLKEIKVLEAQTALLKQKIRTLKESPAAYEEVIRKKLGYIKDGEKVIIYSRKGEKFLKKEEKF